MFAWSGLKRGGGAAADAEAILKALSRSQATIEFGTDGTILGANGNFLATMGYELAEIVGQHHRIFVEPAIASGRDYAEFWAALHRGEFRSAEFRRLGKGGREVWIRASYNPVCGPDGRPYKIIKVATDVTAEKLHAADMEGQIAAIHKSQAVIEFTPTGEILSANQNFLEAMGYRLEDIRGRHHEMFVSRDQAQSPAYREFWARLGRGEYQAAEYKRIGKGGREVWIQATYNPILDLNGRVLKVVKYATDVTARKQAVDQLGKCLAKLADGDLSAGIKQSFAGELDEVRLALNHTVARISEIVGQLRQTSGALRGTTADILAGAGDLSERTHRQAGAIAATTGTIERLSATVVDNAQRAATANTKSQAVLQLAEQGGEVMRRANAAMDRISTSSSRISNIIGMIDDIAFQTNLLALNASVEAARAGDAGKGFAVVAIEVRRLAQSAASASSEVKHLIEQSGTEVKGGSLLVGEAADKLVGMLGAVEENGALIEAIARATQEQSQAISEATAAVRAMDEMTHQNAALVEQVNASIAQTEEQARDLDMLVEHFVIDEAPRAAPPVPASARPVRPEPAPARAKSAGPRAAAARYLVQPGATGDGWSEF